MQKAVSSACAVWIWTGVAAQDAPVAPHGETFQAAPPLPQRPEGRRTGCAQVQFRTGRVLLWVNEESGRILVVFVWSAFGGFVSSSCFVGGPMCEESEERSLNVALSLTESEVGNLSPENRTGRLRALVRTTFVEDAQGETVGTLTCSARASKGGCGGGYVEPGSVGGAGGAGGSGP